MAGFAGVASSVILCLNIGRAASAAGAALLDPYLKSATVCVYWEIGN